MNSQEITLIKDSFARIEPQIAAIFYAQLFELDPSLRGLFHGNMDEQGRKLMQVLGYVVSRLDRLDSLVPEVRQLGLRHAGYQVRDAHYDSIGAALLWTLSKGLGNDFTLDARIAWGKAYWLLAETLKVGTRDGAAQANRAVA
jgi:nitric oxide dioxygenase